MLDETLVKDLFLGNTNSIVPVIEALKPVINKLVDYYVYGLRNQADAQEIQEIADLELVTIINACSRGEFANDNLQALVRSRVRGKIKNFLYHDGLIRIASHDKPPILPLHHEGGDAGIDSFDSGDEECEAAGGKFIPRAHFVPAIVYRPVIMQLIEDVTGKPYYQYSEYTLIDECGFDQKDAMIAFLRLEGWSQTEIAEKLDIGVATVNAHLEIIKAQLKRIGIHPAARPEPEGDKVCAVCKTRKPLTEYYWNRVFSYYYADCKICHRAKVKKPAETVEGGSHV